MKRMSGKMDLRERLKRKGRVDPYPIGALFYNSVAFEGGNELYSGDLDEQRLSDIRNVSKELQLGKCIIIINEHDMADKKPFLLACGGKLFTVGGEEYELPYERALKRLRQEEEVAGLGRLFG